ncbi:MAG: TrkH family potassium uptake protein [Clostridium sp.]
MNYLVMLNFIGNAIKYELLLLLIPYFVALYYGDGDANAFLFTILLVLPFSIILSKLKSKNKAIYGKEGFLTVGLIWIAISVVGAMPFVISGAIPSVVDAFFETVSGFTTTGASILTEIESLPRGILFWRSFTHWVGGMGVLIFILAIMPSFGGNTIHLLRAESPGPTPGKIVPKIKETAKILYIIYFALTIIEAILLYFAGMSPYDSIVHAMGTAGTGGFSIMNTSIAAYDSPLIDGIITVFMLLFGVNFVLYFQLLKGNVKAVFKSEELKWYVAIVSGAIIIITINILGINGGNILESFRQSSFQVASIVTTTGYATVDFNLWPTLSKMILLMLMFMGAMAGSTGGGIKVVRISIIFKAIRREINKILHPRMVKGVKIEGKIIEEETISGVFIFIFAYIVISLIAIFIVSFDGFDMVTTSSSVIATLSNIGPGYELVGATGNFSAFSDLSKLVLSFCMLAGRLEIYPMLIMFSPSMWRKR